MPKAVQNCRVCGKEYECCRTPNTTGMFRWRDVACSVECGLEYLERIERSRGVVSEADSNTDTAGEVVAPTEEVQSVNYIAENENDVVRNENDSDVVMNDEKKNKRRSK